MEETIYLFRKGTKVLDPGRETVDRSFRPPAVGMLGRLLPTSIVYPKGDFLSPIDFLGFPLKAWIKDPGLEITIHPRIRLIGAAKPDGGKQLATALFHQYESQIAAVRRIIDSLFRATLGDRPDTEKVEQMASPGSDDYTKLKEAVQMELGLNVSWSLLPEPEIADWLDEVRRECPATDTLSYNEELPETKFKLTFSISVGRASLSNIPSLRNRYRNRLAPKDEISHLFKRIHIMTNPAFKRVWTGLNVWNRDLVRAMASNGFVRVVSERLEKECGYHVSFSDFTPEPSEHTVKVYARALEDKISNLEIEYAQKEVERLLEYRNQIKANMEVYDKDDPDLKRVNDALEAAKQEVKDAKQGHVNASREVPKMLDDFTQEEKTKLVDQFVETLKDENPKLDGNYSGQ